MKHCIQRLIFILLVSNSSVQAIGLSSVITLEFPVGAENTALGESGVSYANTIHSVFWNPANVACIHEATSVNCIYSKFHEKLLPLLQIPDLYHDFSAFSTSLNNVFPFVDIGYAYFRNYLNFGDGVITDSLGIPLDTIHSDEEVKAHCFGVRAFDMLSLGMSVKNYNSKLAPGIDPLNPKKGTAQGQTFDIGLRINKKSELFGLLTLNPAFGVSYCNFGGDSANYMVTIGESDPLPTKGIVGGSFELSVLDMIGYSFIHEVDFNVLSKPNLKITHTGHKIQITPFYALLRGTMDDSAGHRYEKYEGTVFSFNFKIVVGMISKILKLIDIINNSHHLDAFNTLMKYQTLSGFTVDPNFYFSKTHSVIHTKKKLLQIREGQTRDDWSIGLGIVAEFPAWKQKQIHTRDKQQP